MSGLLAQPTLPGYQVPGTSLATTPPPRDATLSKNIRRQNHIQSAAETPVPGFQTQVHKLILFIIYPL
ncbi:hypothetical protein PtA15_15A11 [Puccinia triticina]|uniref:Uncharacterized protein n=1 Tax=Puccinia triticina TaxID=208348 RepID=A0ABY7D5R8_9BASI|nr:uncharacterized protein PtA15_15A11 [Puccinia triticina]WAQ91622.1 hypothetical protein PtA15_15A11 [Puccinia triticina]